jgi:hypothetical protein
MLATVPAMSVRGAATVPAMSERAKGEMLFIYTNTALEDFAGTLTFCVQAAFRRARWLPSHQHRTGGSPFGTPRSRDDSPRRMLPQPQVGTAGTAHGLPALPTRA